VSRSLGDRLLPKWGVIFIHRKLDGKLSEKYEKIPIEHVTFNYYEII
jgi:hypothetical protein